MTGCPRIETRSDAIARPRHVLPSTSTLVDRSTDHRVGPATEPTPHRVEPCSGQAGVSQNERHPPALSRTLDRSTTRRPASHRRPRPPATPDHMTTSRRRKPARHNPGPLAADHLPALAAIVCDLRPGWDRGVVLAVLTGHRDRVDGSTLVRAAVDAADDPTVVDPRAITWGLRRAEHAPVPRCAVCGQPADVCVRRPGLDDDHEFTDKSGLSS